MRSAKDSEDETEQKTGRMRSQKINISSTVNSPLRRSSRIKHIKNSPSSESDTSSVSSHQAINTNRRATIDNTDIEKRGRPRKFSISPDDNQSMDVDIVGTPKKRATRSSLAAVTTDTPTKINTRAASKRVMRAVSESNSPLPVVRTTRRTRASSVDPESLSDQNRSQPSTPVKTHKRVLSNSPIKKEDEKKIRIPYVRLDTTIVEIDELTNSGNSDTSPDKALRSQKSPKINKKQGIHEDNEKDNSDKITFSFVSLISPAPSESDEILQLSEERNNIHDKHVDEITADSETIPVGECKDEEDLLSNEDTTDEVSTKDNFSNLSNKKEYKLETINKNSPEMEKLLQNIHCELPPATKKVIKIKLGVESSDTSTEDQKGSPSNKENQILNIINDTSIEINTQSITNETSSSTKCLTPMCANKSLSKKEIKFTKNESSLNERRHSKESIETTMKHDILFEEDNIEEKMDISTDSLTSDSTHKQKNLNSSSVNDTAKRHSLVCEADSKSTTRDTNKSVLTQHEDVEMINEVIVKDKIPIKQISKSTKMEEVTKDKVDKMEYSIIDINSDINEDCNKIELNKISFLPKNKDDADWKIKKKKSVMIAGGAVIDRIMLISDKDESLNELSSSKPSHSNLSTEVVSLVKKDSNNQSNIIEKQSVTTQGNIKDSTKQEQRNFSKYATVPEYSSTASETLNSASNESNEDNSAIQNTQPLNETEVEYVTSISPKRAERKRMWLKNSAKENLNRKSTNDIDDHIEKEKENLQLENQKNKNTNTDPDVSTNLLRDTSSDNSNKKIIEKEIDVETVSMSPLLSKESENESETECDLVLVNKKAWLAAENIKAAKEAESFEYDSDDTVLLKSQLDARTTSYDAKQLATINEEGSRDKKSLTMMEDKKIDYDNKALNFPKDKKRCVLNKRENSFSSSEDLAAAVNKSLTEYKANKSLNKSGDRSVSKLNKSGQTIAKTTERSFKTHDEPDEQIENDTNELNRSSQINKKNTYLSKSMERRKSQLDHSKKKPDNMDTDLKKKLKKKHSLNKSQNKDENASKPEEQNFSKSINTKTSTEVNDDESDDSEVVVPVMDFGCKNYFKRMHKSPARASLISTPDKMLDSSDEDESKSQKLVMINSDTETSISTHSNSDIQREYNLDGVEEKFSDDNIPGDECRASESEDSDPDDDGSDLADFIVNDNEIEKEEDNDDDDEEEKEESNNEGEKEENIEEIRDVEEEDEDVEEGEDKDAEEGEDKDAEEGEDKDADEGEDKDAEEGEDKDAEEEQSEDAEEEEEEEAGDAEEEVDDESENEQNVKEKDKVAKKKKIDKKSNMAKNKTILLDTSNSDSSIKNKSMQKNEDILLDTSSNLSAKKKKKSEVPFSKNVRIQKLIEQLKAEACQPSLNVLKHSTPKFDTSKKFEFYEPPLEENLEIEDTNKSGSTKTIENTSLKKKELEIKDQEEKRREEIHKETEALVEEHYLKSFNEMLARRNSSKTSETLEDNSEIKNTKSIEQRKTTEEELLKFHPFYGIPGLKLSVNATNNESLTTSIFQSNLQKHFTKTIQNTSLKKRQLELQDRQIKREEMQKKAEATVNENLTKIQRNAFEISEDQMKLQLELQDRQIKRREEMQKKAEAKVNENLTKIQRNAFEISEDQMKLQLELQDRQIKRREKMRREKEELQLMREREKAEVTILDKFIEILKEVKASETLEDNSEIKNTKSIEQRRHPVEEHWRCGISDDFNEEIPRFNLTVNATNTESPTTSIFQSNRYLGKEKLNESAPELGADRLEKTSSVKQTKDIAQTETLESIEKEIFNLITPLNDETVQKSDRKKQKKRKTSVNDISGENIIDLPIIQAMRESEVPKKKKYTKLATDIIVEDDTCKDTHQINEKEKKQKKRKLQIMEQNENINEVLHKNIGKKITKFIQHKDQNYKAKDVKIGLNDYHGSYLLPNEQIKQPKIAENQELILEKLLRRMNEEEEKKTKQPKIAENQELILDKIFREIKEEEEEKRRKIREEKKTSQLEVGTSKLKSDKNPASNESQNMFCKLIPSNQIESENTAYAKARDKALQVIYETEMRLRAKKALKKKREEEKIMIQKQRILNDKKQRKQVVEKNDCLPSTSRVKRLSDDVLENLPDQPMKAKKKQKISQSQERITSSGHSSSMTVKDDKNSFTLSTSGSTTKFTVVDLSKAKKLSSSTAVASFRKRFLARNSLEPVSAYVMYLEKQKATANSRSSRKAF